MRRPTSASVRLPVLPPSKANIFSNLAVSKFPTPSNAPGVLGSMLACRRSSSMVLTFFCGNASPRLTMGARTLAFFEVSPRSTSPSAVSLTVTR
ncbi:hypothetical protein D3C72_1677330 [compost metagenome]